MLKDPGVAYGVISGFPVHDSYPFEDRDQLDKLFREDYFAWEAMSRAAISRFAKNRSDAEAPIAPSPFSHYRVNGWWEYEGRRIVDNGFILFGPSDALHDFMKGHNRPYILKTETQRKLYLCSQIKAPRLTWYISETWKTRAKSFREFIVFSDQVPSSGPTQWPNSLVPFPIRGSTFLGIL